MSLADLIVLAGNTGVEQAAKNAGFTVNVPLHQVEWMLLKNKLMLNHLQY